MTAAATIVDDTSIIHECIDELAEKHGEITSELLLKVAKSKNHPLHGMFEWDDNIAARKWRLEQAAQMIRAYKFTVYLNEREKEHPIQVRKYVVVPGGEGRYIPRSKAMVTINVREDFINRKISTLQSWCNETADVEEFANLRNTILRGLAKLEL